MVMYPPLVSLAGFVNVDRELFRSVSNLTKELECCNKQVRLIPLRNSVKINLRISGGGLAQFLLDTLVYCTGTFARISVRVFLMDRQKLEVLKTSGVLLQRVPTYEKKHYIYAHAIFCTELPFTTKIITTINMTPLGTKRITFLKLSIKNISTAPLNLKASFDRIDLGYSDHFKFKRRKPLIN
jgi:hypothetical protein